tara:strand:+ start:220 stop:615 length:396 start_codon:yes stop_codon:yes gene_type:complete
MSLKVYFYKYENTSPIILLASKTSSEKEEEIYQNYYLNFYEILYSKDYIKEDSILIFCNFKADTMKKQLQVQGSVNSDKEILEDLNKSINNTDEVVNQIILKYNANYLIEISDKIKIKSTNVKLNFLDKLN